MAICILGDIHFASHKDFLIATCEKFLEWFKNWERNSPENYLILTGDLVHDYINGGVVINFLERFIQTSRFKEIHICVGNHDMNKYQNLDQLAYEFYNNKPNVFIYKKAAKAKIGSLNTLILPYFTGINDEGKTMSEYYSNIWKNKEFKDHYDLTVGHFCGEDNSFPGATDCVKNLDKINTDKLCLGHIHTRHINPRVYIGSVYAGRKNENDYTRSAWVCDEEGWKEERLPIFNEFITFSYPDPLPNSKSLVPIYTILNCSSEKLARDKYGNIFIRRSTIEAADFIAKKLDNEANFNYIKNINIPELFKEFLKVQSPLLNEDVINNCKNALKIR